MSERDDLALRAAALDADRKLDASVPMTEVWRQLMDGRWRIVDDHEVDGRRLLVAEEVCDDDRDPLPVRAQHAAYLLARGASQKQVAYELSLHRSTVARMTRTLLDRLGLRSTMELSALFGSALKRHPELAPPPLDPKRPHSSQ